MNLNGKVYYLAKVIFTYRLLTQIHGNFSCIFYKTRFLATVFVLAWFFCVTLSILVARFMRRNCFWFQVG